MRLRYLDQVRKHHSCEVAVRASVAQVVALDVGSQAAQLLGDVGAVRTLDVPGGKVCIRHQIGASCLTLLGLGGLRDGVLPTVDHPPLRDDPLGASTNEVHKGERAKAHIVREVTCIQYKISVISRR